MKIGKIIENAINEYIDNNELDLSDYDSAYRFAMKYGSDIFFDDDGEYDDSITDSNGYTLKELIDTYMSYYRDINNESYVKLYRTIRKDKLKDIDYNNFGIYFSKSNSGANAYGSNLNRPEGKNLYTFTIEVEPEYINWADGFYAFLTYGINEDEIQLIKNSPIEIIDIEYNDKHKSISKFART